MVLVLPEQNLVRATLWTTAEALPELWGLSDVQWRLDNLPFPESVMISFLFLFTVGLLPVTYERVSSVGGGHICWGVDAFRAVTVVIYAAETSFFDLCYTLARAPNMQDDFVLMKHEE